MNIAIAKRDIADAERGLRELIAAIELLPRAEKVTLSNVVRDAFEKLRDANGRLETLVKVLDE